LYIGYVLLCGGEYSFSSWHTTAVETDCPRSPLSSITSDTRRRQKTTTPTYRQSSQTPRTRTNTQ